MDGPLFDHLVRSIAGKRSRRTVIAAIASVVLGPFAGRKRAGAESDCPAGYLFCDDRCVLPTNDYSHCGGCGISCGDAACINGVCAACETVGRTTCFDPYGTGYCADVMTSWNDCGECGNRCTTGPCVNGACESTADCDPGLTECFGRCVDLQTDVYNCGRCSNGCTGIPGPGISSVGACVDGACQIVCLDGFSLCAGGTCVDLTSDSANCGACGNVCADGICNGGSCGGSQTTTESDAPVATEPSDTYAGDGDVLNEAISIERTLAALFRKGLADFPSASFAGYSRDTRTKLGRIRDHEIEHQRLLEGELSERGGTLPEAVTDQFTFENVEAFIQRAWEVKEISVAAYVGLLPAITEPRLASTLAAIATVEARHAAYLASLLREPPFSSSSDQPMTRSEVNAALAEVLGR